MIKYFRLLLLPFSLIYGIIIILRNKCYDWGFLKAVRFDIPVICVGNLVVGGSGKSPVTEYLVSLLGDYKIAILSRGYGRQTTGFLYADETSTAKSIGDEPLQFYHKFPGITVAVCENRVLGINKLKPEHDLIILDDAFQHRSVNPGFSILLFEFQKLLEPQFILPAGNMREPFWGYRRADMLLVTKSPEHITAGQQLKCNEKFSAEARAQLYFSVIQYADLIGIYTDERLGLNSLRGKSVFLLTGIANPQPLLEEIRKFTDLVVHHDYPDHHDFTQNNIVKLQEEFSRHPDTEKIIITTEKDAQRLFDEAFKELLLNLPIFYLPIKIVIQADRKEAFNQKILTYVSNTTGNCRIHQEKK